MASLILPCTYCDATPLNLLDYDVDLAWVRCGSCLQRWWHDTGVGGRRHPEYLLCELFDAA